jgi:HlyD family secretion protein
VKPDTVILELSNPQLRQAVMDAQLAHASALANFTNRQTELQRALLDQQSQVAQIETQFNNSKLNLEAQEELLKDGLVSELNVRQIRSATKDLENRLSIARQQLEMTRNGITSQLAPQQAEVDQREAQYRLRVQELEDLKVKAGMDGVLSQVPV